MDNMVLQRAAEIKKEHQFTKRWQRVVAIICAITVIGTANALILPAITEQAEAYCGHEEHVHSVEAGCYEEKTVLDCQFEGVSHVHGDACYEEHQVLTCGLEESSGHMHSDACYAEQQNLICMLPEDENHTHGSECYETVRELVCGLEESEGHAHSAACYTTERNLICGLEEGELEQTHEHTEECYHTELVFMCDKEEHQHTLACFSNPDADLESSAVWEQSIRNAALTGVWADDVLAIVNTQLGYTESTRNYIVLDDGVTMKGYTRYGAWYGNAYGDWCAMFCSFCLNYAGVDRSMMPIESSCRRWVEELAGLNLYHAAGSYDPEPGDLVFFAGDTDGNANHVGFVYEISGNTMKTIEGNNGPVAYHTHSLSEGGILGYGELPENPNQPVQAEPEALFLECSCGAAEGEPHAVDCPLYAAPEETESECTCGAAEGESHAEDCPLYELMSSEDEEEYFSITSNETENGVSVMVCGPVSSFPHAKEEIVVRLTQLADENDEIAEAIDEQTEEEAVSELMLFDITLFRGDEEIQPTGPIELRFIGIENNDSGNVQTYHVEDEDNINPVETTVDDDGVIFVETDHFSLYAVALYNSYGQNIGNYVSVDNLDVTLNNTKIIEDGRSVYFPQTPDIYGMLEIKDELEWSINPSSYRVHKGDYFIIPVAKFSSYDYDADLSLRENATETLYWNGYPVGTRTWSYDSSTGWMSYRVDFTMDGLENYVGLNGKGDITFYSNDVEIDSYNIIQVSGGDYFYWYQGTPPSPSGGTFGPMPDTPGADYKERSDRYYYGTGEIEWSIRLRELVDTQFSENIQFEDYLIVEDTLDPYQTFFNPDYAAWYSEGIQLRTWHNMYLVNAANNGFSGYCLGGYTAGDDKDVGNITISADRNAYIDPDNYGSEAAAEAYVRSHAKTFTVVHCTVNGDTVEKLILNLGKPGVNGYKWSDLTYGISDVGNSFQEVLNALISQRDLCQAIANSQPSYGMNDKIRYQSWEYTKGQWLEFVQMYNNSYNYYSRNPYLYNWKISVNSYIKTDNGTAMTVPTVMNNAYVYGAPYTTHSLSATASNDWHDFFDMRISDHDVFIGKYDAVTGEQNFNSTNMAVSSPVKAAFEVRNSRGQALRFTQSESAANEYTYNGTSSTATQVWTADDGKMILRNLPYGQYSLYEVDTDLSYYVPSANSPIKTFEVKNDGNGAYVGVGNNKRRVVVEKVDFDDPSQSLSGAQFELYKLNPGSDEYEKMSGFTSMTEGGQTFIYYSGNGLGYLTTNSNGKIDLRGLECGSYYLKEITPPEGHVITSEFEKTYFTLSRYEDNDNLTSATDGGPKYMAVIVKNHTEQHNASLTITKTVTLGSQTEPFSFEVTLKDANDQSVPLTPGTYTPSGSDVSYTVAADNTITFTLTHGQSVIIEDIPIGTLATVKETSHAGYNTIVKKGEVQISSSYELTDYEVTEDSEITYYNNRGAELPETGGIGTTPIYALGAMLMAGASMWGCKLRRRRERRAR